LASVPGNLPFAAKLVAAQKPAVKSVVVLKKELSGCDPDFLSGIHNQLATLSITKHGDASGYAFVRSVLKEANPANHLEMLLFTQLLAVHDAMMTSSKLLGEAKTLEEVNSHGNNLNKLARTFAALLETLHRCRSGPEPKLTVQNLSVRDGGQAIVGNVTHSAGGSGTTDAAKAPLSQSDQSVTAMPNIQPDEQSTTTVPRIVQDQEPAPSSAKGKRRA